MAIHSRTFLLLKRDLVNLQRFPLTGISAAPTDSRDLFHWTAKVEGLTGTIWEGGVFQVTLRFNEHFNEASPQINFMTIPFHPNVDPGDGSPSLHLISEEEWSGGGLTVSALLLALQALLSNPELDSGCVLNPSAAHLLKDAPHTYKQMVLDCVTASLRIDAGLTPYEPDTPPQSPKLVPVKSTQSVSKPAKPISYDDYHVLWKGIATSVSEYKQNSDFFQLLEKDPKLRSVHRCTSDHRGNIEAKIDQHTDIKYGKPPKSKVTQKITVLSAKSRQKRVEELKNMYRKASEDASDNPSVVLPQDTPLSIDIAIADDSGDDVDQLVQWTKDLSEKSLLLS